MYVGFAALFSLLASEFVAPTPAGWLARRELATVLRGCGQLVWTACDIASGEVGRSGRLAAASGKQSEQLSIDSGLFDKVWPLHAQSSALGTRIQVGQQAHNCLQGAGLPCHCGKWKHSRIGCSGGLAAHATMSAPCLWTEARKYASPCVQSAMTHIATARWEVDVYRPTHLLPYVTSWQRGVLARSLLRCAAKGA